MTRARAAAAAASIAALSLYIATLAPGLVALEDTPKFQFIGRVLGTAHNPGYPLYVVVSHVFGWLPLGNLAWRINLMSAVWAAATCGLLALIITEVVGGWMLPVAGALGLATGALFWSASTIAEVYTLHSCLIAGMLHSLLVWRRTGRDRWFYLAIGCFSLGLGHHTSIVLVGPAVAVFAVMTRPRFALAPTTMAGVLGLFALGFSQYLFILLRTHQHAYLESTATNLTQLWGVIRGADWSGDLRPLGASTVATHMPDVARAIFTEVSGLVAVCSGIGVVGLAVRDRALLALSVGTLLGATAFAVLFPGQTGYFLLPAYLVMWMLAASGLGWLSGRLGRARQQTVTTAMAVGVAGVALWHGATNLQANDRSHDRFPMRYFEALVHQLPDGAALVDEDWLVDRMVLYEKFAEPVFAARHLTNRIAQTRTAVMAALADGHQVFAFAKGSERLRLDGVDFEPAPHPLEYGSLRTFIDDLPRGTLVALAIPSQHLSTWVSARALPLDRIGAAAPSLAWSNVAMLGVVGRDEPVYAETSTMVAAVASVGGGSLLGGTGTRAPRDIVVQAAWERASIRVGTREIVSSGQPVVAWWDRSGTLQGAVAIGPDGRMPMPDSSVAIHRLRSVRTWRSIGPEVTTLTDVAGSGHLFIRSVRTVPLIVYASRAQLLEPRAFDASTGDGQMAVTAFMRGAPALMDALDADGWPVDAAARLDGPFIYRVELSASDGVRQLNFGGVPDLVLARWGGSGNSPSVYGLDLAGQMESVDSTTSRLHVARDYHQLFLANGWSPVEDDEAGTGGVATTTATTAELLMPGVGAHDLELDLQLRARSMPSVVSLAVNGQVGQEQSIAPGWQRYRWQVPHAVLRTGMNSLVLRVTAPVQVADMLVRSVVR